MTRLCAVMSISLFFGQVRLRVIMLVGTFFGQVVCYSVYGFKCFDR